MICRAVMDEIERLADPDDKEITVHLKSVIPSDIAVLAWAQGGSVRLIADANGLSTPALALERDGDVVIVPESEIRKVEFAERVVT